MTKDEFMSAIEIIAESVWNFHERWGFEGSKSKDGNVVGLVLRDPQELFENERHQILDEEINEFKEAISKRQLDQASLELGDVLFVVIGHCKAYDRNICSALKEIAKKNDNKTNKTHAIRSDTGKLLSLGKVEKWSGAEEERRYHLLMSYSKGD